jgi:hypothetical protein
MQITDQEIIHENEEFRIILFKLDGLHANYSLIIRKGLFTDILIKDFIKMMSDYIVMDDPNVEVIEDEKITPEKVIPYLME